MTTEPQSPDSIGPGTDPGAAGADAATRLTKLEARLADVEETLASLTNTISERSSGSKPSRLATIPPPRPGTAIAPPPPSPSLGPVQRLERRPSISAEAALRWAGVVLVVFSALFFVSTAISRGWIGPNVQLSLAALGGATLIGTGVYLDHRWARERRPWSLALTNAGVVVLGICAAAAHSWLGVVSTGVSTLLLAAILVLALLLADRLDHESLVVSGLAVALIGPGVVDAYTMFGEAGTGLWMLMLVAVTMAVAWHCRWTVPRLLGLVIVGPIMVALTGDLIAPSDSLRLAVQLMVATAGVLWWIAPWLRPAGHPLRPLDQRLVFVVPGLVWMASLGLWATTDGQRAVLALVVAAVFGLLAVAIRVVGPGIGISVPDNLALGYLVAVSALVSAALALWLDGPVLLTALTVQALGTVALAAKVEDLFLDISAAVLGAIVGSWTAFGLVDGIDAGLTVGEGAAFLFAVVAIAASAVLVGRRSVRLSGVLAVASWVGLLSWIMAVLRPLPQGQMMVSIMWTVLGVVLVVLGLGAVISDSRSALDWWQNRRNDMKTVGLATLAATVVKLVTIDLAEVDTIWRALLFAVVGVGLLRLGYSIGLLERSGQLGESSPEPAVEDGTASL